MDILGLATCYFDRISIRGPRDVSVLVFVSLTAYAAVAWSIDRFRSSDEQKKLLYALFGPP